MSDAIKAAESNVIEQCGFLGNERVAQIALETLPECSLIVGTVFARYLKEGMKVINPLKPNGAPVTITRTGIVVGTEPKFDQICFECELGSASVMATDVLFMVSDAIDTNLYHNND